MGYYVGYYMDYMDYMDYNPGTKWGPHIQTSMDHGPPLSYGSPLGQTRERSGLRCSAC